MMMSSKEIMHEYMSYYANLNLPVFPICNPAHIGMNSKHIDSCEKRNSQGKMPLIAGWRNLDVIDNTQIDAWNAQFAHYNIGLKLGGSIGIVGIDIDGEQGEVIFKKIMSFYGITDFPDTWMFRTSTGSRILYRYDTSIEMRKFKVTGTDKHSECAFMCEGQYTVMPPSNHIDGITYNWIEGHSTQDIALGYAPQWILNLIIKDDDQYRQEIALLFAEDNNVDTKTNGTKEISIYGFDISTFNSKEDFKYSPFSNLLSKYIEGTNIKNKKENVLFNFANTETINEGGRNDFMIKAVGSLCAIKENRLLGFEAILMQANGINIQKCNPPLDVEEIRPMVDKILSRELVKDNEFQEKKKPLFNTVDITNKFIKHIQKKNSEIIFDDATGLFYMYNKDIGVWRRDSISLIKKSLGEMMISDVDIPTEWVNIRNEREVLNRLQTITGKGDAIEDTASFFDRGFYVNRYSTHINLQNGMLNWRTGKLEEHGPEYYATTQMRVSFDEKADCSYWLECLAEWVNGDTELIAFIQEFFGTCLVPIKGDRAALFLIGGGSNGKSVLLKTLTDLFGTNDVNYASLTDLKEKFAPHYLVNKSINVGGDIDAGYIKNTGALKGYIAGDASKAEIKGGKSYTIYCMAKFIFSANEMPTTGDKTYGWYSRMRMILFPNRYTVDPNWYNAYFERIVGEYPGIINWALEGLRRYDRKGYTKAVAMEQEAIKYQNSNDNVASFVHNYMIKIPHELSVQMHNQDKYINAIAAYAVYKEYCEDEGSKPIKKSKFYIRVDSLMQIERGKHAIKNGDARIVFKSVRFNLDAPDFKEHYAQIYDDQLGYMQLKNIISKLDKKNA